MADTATPLRAEASLAAFHAHQARKQAELEKMKLENRIRKLEMDKLRGEKMIRETKRKAKLMHVIAERNEKVKVEKEKARAEREAVLAKQREELHERKRLLSASRDRAVKAAHDRKVAVTAAGRQEMQINAEYVKFARAKEHEINVKKKLDVLASEKDLSVKLKAKMHAIEVSALEEVNARKVKELHEASHVEHDMEKLAALEVRLLESLKKTQAEQEKALSGLEAELSDRRATGTRKSSLSQSLRDTLRLDPVHVHVPEPLPATKSYIERTASPSPGK